MQVNKQAIIFIALTSIIGASPLHAMLPRASRAFSNVAHNAKPNQSFSNRISGQSRIIPHINHVYMLTPIKKWPEHKYSYSHSNNYSSYENFRKWGCAKKVSLVAAVGLFGSSILDNQDQDDDNAQQVLTPRSQNSHDVVRDALQNNNLTGPQIIELLSQEYPGLKRLFDSSAQVWEGYTIKEHTLIFFTQFEDQLNRFNIHSLNLKAITSDIKRLLRATIALHDIGKPLGPKKDQHKNTVPILQQTLALWGFNQREITLVRCLVNNDIIGELVQNRYNKTPETACEALINVSQKAGMDLKSYVTLQTLFYVSDASSYPTVREFCMRRDEAGKYYPSSPKFKKLNNLVNHFVEVNNNNGGYSHEIN